MSEITDAAVTAQEKSWEMYLEGAKLVSAYQRIDKDGLRVLVRSLYHNGWNLTDLHLNLQDLTKIQGHVRSDFEDRLYEDAIDLTLTELQKRVTEYYGTCLQIAKLMRGVNTALRELGHYNKVLGFISGRLLNDVYFLKQDIEHITHTALPW